MYIFPSLLFASTSRGHASFVIVSRFVSPNSLVDQPPGNARQLKERKSSSIPPFSVSLTQVQSRLLTGTLSAKAIRTVALGWGKRAGKQGQD